MDSHCCRHIPDPIEAITFRLEQGELTTKDLQPMIRRLHL